MLFLLSVIIYYVIRSFVVSIELENKAFLLVETQILGLLG